MELSSVGCLQRNGMLETRCLPSIKAGSSQVSNIHSHTPIQSLFIRKALLKSKQLTKMSPVLEALSDLMAAHQDATLTLNAWTDLYLTGGNPLPLPEEISEKVTGWAEVFGQYADGLGERPQHRSIYVLSRKCDDIRRAMENVVHSIIVSGVNFVDVIEEILTHLGKIDLRRDF